MEQSLYQFILKYSVRSQIALILLTAASMPFVYLSLEVPKIIINEALGDADSAKMLLGMQFGSINYLLILSSVFLLLVGINGGFKYVINVYRGILGERMLRRLRYQLYLRLLRFPLPHFKRVSQAEVIPMVVAETEPLGGFIGESFSLPAFQGGLLITYLFFIFNQDVLLGFAATALYPFQMWLIPKLQLKVNTLSRQRVLAARQLAKQIGHSVSGITEIIAHDTSHYERAEISEQLGLIYRIRYEVYKKKFFIKFLNNFLAQITPFFFYSVGGYFVIQGELSLGALVAVLAAYKDLINPWKELLKYYQVKEVIQAKYSQVVENFCPSNMLSEALIDADAQSTASLAGEIVSSNISYSEEEAVKLVDSANFKIDTYQHTLLLGAIGSGKDELARLLARLISPNSGQIRINGLDLAQQPLSITGRLVSYVGQNVYLFAGSVRDNITYGLKHRPLGESSSTRQRDEYEVRDAVASGNSTDDRQVDWIDYKAAGVIDSQGLDTQIINLLQEMLLQTDIYHLGLRSTINAYSKPDLVEKILHARAEVQRRIERGDIEHVIEQYDQRKYNACASVAENLLFGTPRNNSRSIEYLVNHEFVLKVLQDVNLLDELHEIGYKIADTMIELFADLPPEHEFFEQFSFIRENDLPDYQVLLSRIESRGMESLEEGDKGKFLSLAFKLVPARHRLDLIDDKIQARLLQARLKFRLDLPDELKELIEFFDVDQYNAQATLQDNILFGKPMFANARAQPLISEVLHKVVEDLDLRDEIIKVGLNYDIGTGGSKLSLQQRQKVALLRCLIKRPDILIVNKAAGVLEADQEQQVLKNIQKLVRNKGLIWISTQANLAEDFDHILLLGDGRILERGSYSQLLANKSWFHKMLISA